MDRQGRSTSKLEDAFAAFPGFSNITPMMLLPWRAWLNVQSDVLAAVTPAANEWLNRRREGAAAALQAIDRLSKCKDVQDASKVQAEWFADETKRVQDDMRCFGDQALALSRAAEKVTREAAQVTTASA